MAPSALFLFISVSLFHTTLSADCTAYGDENNCQLVSGCTWYQNGCICATDVKVDIIFAIDRSGSIHEDPFEQAKAWLSDFVQSGLPKDPRLGFVFFSSPSQSYIDKDLQYWDMSTLVSYIQHISYPGGSTYTDMALDDSIQEYQDNGDAERQKLLIMITDGQPNCNGCDICTRASTLKSLNIRTIILGVGSGLTEKYVECLLQDTVTDYIPVNSFDYDDFQSILPALSEITCPVSYNMKITEVKAQTDTNPFFGSRFVEIFNLGSTVNGAEIRFEGLVQGTLSNSVSVLQSKYLVLYEIDDTFENVTCVNCGCNTAFQSPFAQITPSTGYYCDGSLYYPCSASSNSLCSFDGTMENSNWEQSIYDISEGARELIEVVNTTQDGTWPIILDGWTVELKEIGFDNDAGNNWEQSCYNTGTPGDTPITCPHSDCSDETCIQNGADGAKMNDKTGFCTCPTHYYPTGCTCKKVPNPSNCMAQRVKNVSNDRLNTLYTWDRVDYDEIIQYRLDYMTDYTHKSKTIVYSYGLIKTVKNYDWEEYGITHSAGNLSSCITIGDHDYCSEQSDCTPITQSPTEEPTPAPSTSPIPAPTNNPTQSPIHLLPWLFIGGICNVDRCDCNDNTTTLITNKTCCMDGELDNCTLFSNEYAFTDDTQYITIQSYDEFGNAYIIPFNTTLYYKFEYLGLQNLTAMDSGESFLAVLDVENDNDEDNDSECREPETPPVAITPMNGSIVFGMDAESSTASIPFDMQSAGQDRVECKGGAIFKLTLLQCNSSYTLNMNEKCEIVYPYEYVLYIQQPISVAPLSWWEREGKGMLWWMIAALAAVLLLVAFLVYKFWYKTRVKGKALLDKENEMQNLIEEEELGMAPGLKEDQFGFNPLAFGSQGNGGMGTGNVGMAGDDQIPKDERANVMIDKFEQRQQYGPQGGAYRPPVIN